MPDVAVDYGVWDKGYSCRCEIISMVREDIAYKIIQYANDTHIPHSPQTACQRCDIVAAYNFAAKIAYGEYNA
jgi:hypothetical protein